MRFTLSIILALVSSWARAQAAPTTGTGIPLDSDWKKNIYKFAQANVIHPAWGLAHSERDYQVAVALAKREAIPLDLDVLFAAAFLHDLGGIGSFAQKGVDHAVRSVQIIEPLLPTWGYPMDKFPQVKDMILGHTYYGPVPTSRPALAFRDADVVDFLGAIGAARLLAVTEEPDFADGTLKPTVSTLKDFAQTMKGKCSLSACAEMAVGRQKELTDFLSQIDAETFSGQAL